MENEVLNVLINFFETLAEIDEAGKEGL